MGAVSCLPLADEPQRWYEQNLLRLDTFEGLAMLCLSRGADLAPAPCCDVPVYYDFTVVALNYRAYQLFNIALHLHCKAAIWLVTLDCSSMYLAGPAELV